MDIDKLIQVTGWGGCTTCFGSLMDIDKLIRALKSKTGKTGFGSLMDIDKLILEGLQKYRVAVLVL